MKSKCLWYYQLQNTSACFFRSSKQELNTFVVQLYDEADTEVQSNLSNTDTEGTERSVRRDRAKCPKGQSEVSVLERCPYKRGHHDDVTFMTPLIVLNVQ